MIASQALTTSLCLSVGCMAAAQLPNDPSLVKPLKAGVMAPQAQLMAMDGKATSLKTSLNGKPTVLIFYRGGWCPFCNRHLAEIGKVEKDIAKAGYQIVALTPDQPSFLCETATKNQTGYKLMSDASGAAAKAFGVAFRLDDTTFDKYKNQYGLDLEKRSGKNHHLLPVPAVFLIDAKGMIRFAHTNPDYTKRLSSDEIMNEVKKLSAK